MQIVSIQVLRAVAALLVAFGHAQAFIATPMERLGQTFERNYLLPWGAGVDLFFVISGFIMVYSSERLYGQPGGARTFLFRRCARITPLYWTLTLLAVVIGLLRHKPGLDPMSVLMSFLFVPWHAAGEGVPRPVYELGWTLNYEMFFYALFALTLGFAREVSALIVVAMLAMLALAGWIIQPVGAQAFIWTQPIILEFALGVLLALAVRRNVTLPRPVRLMLIGTGVTALWFDLLQSHTQPYAWVTPDDFRRVLGWGVPAALILAGATLKAKMPAKTPLAPTRALAHLGDASYALYLCHPIVMSVFSALWYALGLNNRLSAWTGVGLSMILSAAAAVFVYRFFEAPVTRALQNYAPGMKTARVPAE